MPEKVKVVARWAVLVPSSLVAAVVARVVVVFLNMLTLGSDFMFFPGAAASFMSKAIITWGGGTIMGIVGVYAAYVVAPTHRKIAASFVGGLWLMIAGALLFVSILS